MFCKMVATILAAGACAAMTLSLRQQQVAEAHALARARLDAVEIEEQLRRAKVRIGRLAHPEIIEHRLDELGPMKPALPPRPAQPPVEATAMGPFEDAT